VSLGTFDFADTGGENVTLTDNADSWVIADAVKFEAIIPPTIIIIDVQVVDITDTTARITWTTNVPGDSCVNIGDICEYFGYLTQHISDRSKPRDNL